MKNISTISCWLKTRSHSPTMADKPSEWSKRSHEDKERYKANRRTARANLQAEQLEDVQRKERERDRRYRSKDPEGLKTKKREAREKTKAGETEEDARIRKLDQNERQRRSRANKKGRKEREREEPQVIEPLPGERCYPQPQPPSPREYLQPLSDQAYYRQPKPPSPPQAPAYQAYESRSRRDSPNLPTGGVDFSDAGQQMLSRSRNNTPGLQEMDRSRRRAEDNSQHRPQDQSQYNDQYPYGGQDQYDDPYQNIYGSPQPMTSQQLPPNLPPNVPRYSNSGRDYRPPMANSRSASLERSGRSRRGTPTYRTRNDRR